MDPDLRCNDDGIVMKRLLISSSKPIVKDALILKDLQGNEIEFEFRRAHFNLLTKIFRNSQLQYWNMDNRRTLLDDVKIGISESIKLFRANKLIWLRHIVFQYEVVIRTQEETLLRFEFSSIKGKVDSKLWVSRLANLRGVVFWNNTSLREMDLYRKIDKKLVMIWAPEIGLESKKQFTPESLLALKTIGPYDFRAVNLYRPDLEFQGNGFQLVNVSNAIVSGAFLVLQDKHVLEMDSFNSMRDEGIPSSGFIKTSNFNYAFVNRETSHIIEEAIFVGSSSNWCHFLTQSAIRLANIGKLNIQGIPVILGEGCPDQIKEVCELLTGVSPIISPSNTSIFVKSLKLIREYGFSDSFAYKEKAHHLTNLASTLIQQEKLINASPSEKKEREHKKLWLPRKSHQFRGVNNREEVSLHLSELGFMEMACEELSLRDQIDRFEQSEIIVAELGSALTNLLFVLKKPTLILIGKLNQDFEFWEKFAFALGINHVERLETISPRLFSKKEIVDIKKLTRVISDLQAI